MEFNFKNTIAIIAAGALVAVAAGGYFAYQHPRFSQLREAKNLCKLVAEKDFPGWDLKQSVTNFCHSDKGYVLQMKVDYRQDGESYMKKIFPCSVSLVDDMPSVSAQSKFTAEEILKEREEICGHQNVTQEEHASWCAGLFTITRQFSRPVIEAAYQEKYKYTHVDAFFMQGFEYGDECGRECKEEIIKCKESLDVEKISAKIQKEAGKKLAEQLKQSAVILARAEKETKALFEKLTAAAVIAQTKGDGTPCYRGLTCEGDKGRAFPWNCTVWCEGNKTIIDISNMPEEQKMLLQLQHPKNVNGNRAVFKN